MRITSSMYYQNLYATHNQHLTTKLYDVNKQIASGLKIQYASDDVTAFTQTMQLDNEISSLEQITRSAESGYKMSNQSDVVLNEFNTAMNRMRTLFVSAANDTNDETAKDAIAAELRGLEGHLKNIGNTSINGQYLFAGSLVDTKPIDADGKYQGNDVSLNSFLGSGVKQQYNISGAELFLGEEKSVKREISTNVQNNNLLNGGGLSKESTIGEMMGNAATTPSYFYIRGTTSDGTSIKEKVTMNSSDTVESLLEKIGTQFGNTGVTQIVNVSLSAGHIVIEDKLRGSSKLDFHMVGAVDLTGGGRASVTDIDDLDNGEKNYAKISNGSSTATDANLFIKEFVLSGGTSDVANGASSNIEGIIYDRAMFSKNGSTISSTAPQITREENNFATPTTKLSEVADISQATPNDTLASTTFVLSGKNIAGTTYNVTIDLKSDANGGSTFSDGTNTYNIFNASTPRGATDADDVTYQQLMDIVNMVTTGNLPTANTDVAYDSAIEASNFNAETYLSYDGKIQFKDLLHANTQAEIALYDKATDDFSATAKASAMTFNSNNTLTIRDAKTDFFKTVNEMVSAVENYKLYPDSSKGDIRNVGIENAIAMMDTLQNHVFRSHSLIGSQSNALEKALERTSIMDINTKTLRSSVIDTDLAEASLELTKLSINYEAMLSTVGKVAKLSLVNYL